MSIRRRAELGSSRVAPRPIAAERCSGLRHHPWPPVPGVGCLGCGYATRPPPGWAGAVCTTRVSWRIRPSIKAIAIRPWRLRSGGMFHSWMGHHWHGDHAVWQRFTASAAAALGHCRRRRSAPPRFGRPASRYCRPGWRCGQDRPPRLPAGYEHRRDPQRPSPACRDVR